MVRSAGREPAQWLLTQQRLIVRKPSGVYNRCRHVAAAMAMANAGVPAPRKLAQQLFQRVVVPSLPPHTAIRQHAHPAQCGATICSTDLTRGCACFLPQWFCRSGKRCRPDPSAQGLHNKDRNSKRTGVTNKSNTRRPHPPTDVRGEERCSISSIRCTAGRLLLPRLQFRVCGSVRHTTCTTIS